MSYPFTPCVPYQVFLDQLTSHGVQIKEIKAKANNEEVAVAYLSHEVDGKMYYHPLKFSAPGEIVQFHVVRSVCKALRLDPVLFGLTLG